MRVTVVLEIEDDSGTRSRRPLAIGTLERPDRKTSE